MYHLCSAFVYIQSNNRNGWKSRRRFVRVYVRALCRGGVAGSHASLLPQPQERMNRATLQCVIRTKEGVEVKTSEEIWGEGKTYLANLSDNLSRMQADVNTYLTELVEKERGQVAKSGVQPSGDSGEDSSDEDGKDSCPMAHTVAMCM